MPHVDYEREPVPGYDFTFAPYKPINPDYRQLYRAQQLAWLEEWAPINGSYPQ